MEYRREIDGFRAIAVIPVILFHAGFSHFSGGYVGVDVFFVISGYLITTIIISEKEKGSFSLVNFYERRARRIIPALFLVMLVSTLFSWLWLSPSHMKDFSQSLVAVAAFSSNILFWKETGYWGVENELKPLLHTWSLAVEEQYYVLFPLFLMLMWRFRKRWILGSFFLVALGSLTVSHWAAFNEPTANFFLLPTRAWELAIGAAIAFYFLYRKSVMRSLLSHKSIDEVLSWLGVGLIGFAVFAFDEDTPFPSLYALVPTVGTALIIIFTSKDTLVGKLLGSRIPVGIGLISYSAYLWHQPLFVFARHRSLHEPSSVLLGVLSLLSLLLAFLSWKYVEAPFRKRGVFSAKQIFLFTAIGSAFFIAFGLAGHFTQGFEEAWKKMHPEQAITYELLSEAKKQSAVLNENYRLNNNDCVRSLINLDAESESIIQECAKKYGKGIAIIGDSHATNLVNSIYYNNKDKLKFFIGITKNGCHLPTANPDCQYDDFRTFIQRNPDVFSVVIYEKAGWLMLTSKDGRLRPPELQSLSNLDSFNGIFLDEEVVSGVIEYLNDLSRIVPVVWFGPRVEPHIGEKYLLSQICGHPITLRDGQLETYSAIDVVVEKKLFEYPDIHYLSQIDSYKFEFPNDFMSCEKLYWMDGSHFSPTGEIEFGSRFDFIQYLRDNYGIKF